MVDDNNVLLSLMSFLLHDWYLVWSTKWYHVWYLVW